MNNIIRLIVHFFFAVWTVFYFCQCSRLMSSGGFWMSLWSQHVYLTNLTHTLVTIYYLYVLFQDIIKVFGLSKEAKTEEIKKYTYPPATHTYFQLVLSMSMIVGFGYWSLMIIDPKLLWGTLDPEKVNVFYMMYYLHGGNHLHLYLEIFLYKQHVFVTNKKKFTLDCIVLSSYFAITAIQYFVFGKVVYNFQNLGIAVMIPIYILSTLAYTAFDFGFLRVATKIGLYDVSIEEKTQVRVKGQEKEKLKKEQ